MSKKSRDNADKFPLNSDEILDLKDEELIDEEEEEETEDADVDQFEEDEDDLAMIEALEYEDETQALAEFSFEEEAGYNHFYDWDKLKAEDLEKHQEILTWGTEELSKSGVRNSNHFLLWTIARAAQRVGLEKKFRDICNTLIKARKPRPEICYEDVYLELIHSYAAHKEHKAAFEVLDRFTKAFPDSDELGQWVNAFLLIDSSKIHEGKAQLDKLSLYDSATGKVQYEIATTLLSLNHPDLALNYLDKARTLALMNSDSELVTAIDVARLHALEESSLEN